MKTLHILNAEDTRTIRTPNLISLTVRHSEFNHDQQFNKLSSFIINDDNEHEILSNMTRERYPKLVDMFITIPYISEYLSGIKDLRCSRLDTNIPTLTSLKVQYMDMKEFNNINNNIIDIEIDEIVYDDDFPNPTLDFSKFHKLETLVIKKSSYPITFSTGMDKLIYLELSNTDITSLPIAPIMKSLNIKNIRYNQLLSFKTDDKHKYNVYGNRRTEIVLYPLI